MILRHRALLQLAETGRVRQQQRGDWYVRMFGRQQVELYRLRGHLSGFAGIGQLELIRLAGVVAANLQVDPARRPLEAQRLGLPAYGINPDLPATSALVKRPFFPQFDD